MSKKPKQHPRGQASYDSGLELARVLKEKALTVFSPRARFLIRTAKITGTGDLNFVKEAIDTQLIDDTLEGLRKDSNIITKERMISGIISGKYKGHIKDSED